MRSEVKRGGVRLRSVLELFPARNESCGNALSWVFFVVKDVKDSVGGAWDVSWTMWAVVEVVGCERYSWRRRKKKRARDRADSVSVKPTFDSLGAHASVASERWADRAHGHVRVSRIKAPMCAFDLFRDRPALGIRTARLCQLFAIVLSLFHSLSRFLSLFLLIPSAVSGSWILSSSRHPR